MRSPVKYTWVEREPEPVQISNRCLFWSLGIGVALWALILTWVKHL